jgi:Gpi18-like mannosyltransferase
MDSSPRRPLAERAAAVGRLLGRELRTRPWGSTFVLLVGIALALALRYSLLDFKSVDYYSSLKPWYNAIQSEGFAAFATSFSNYNPPYLYLLYMIVRFLPDLPIVAAVKIPALTADFICAYIAYRIVRLKFPLNETLPFLAGMAVLFAPTMVLNSAFWGQADSLYTAGVLACMFFLMSERPAMALLAFGIALAFKLQAVFFTPVLLALAMKGNIPWKSLLLVPLVLLLALLPSWLAGRPVAELLNVYVSQASQYESITMNAASAYAWLPGAKQVFNEFYGPGLIMGAAAAFMWFSVLYRSPRKISGPLLVEVALAAFLIVPFFLPKMHERYFYAADVLSIVFAFLYPQLFFVPILVVGVSFLSYEPFLFETELLPLPVLTVVYLSAICFLFYHSMRQLYFPASESADHNSPPEDVHAA